MNPAAPLSIRSSSLLRPRAATSSDARCFWELVTVAFRIEPELVHEPPRESVFAADALIASGGRIADTVLSVDPSAS